MTLLIKFLIIGIFGLPSFLSAAPAPMPEEIWKSLEKLPPAEREKKLVEGAKKEGEMLWYTNSGIENATRYIQAFKKNYPFINAQVWRAKTRQVTQRAISEANAGKHLVDVIKPSTDLLPVMLEKTLIGKYDTPIRAIYPAHAKSPFYTNMNYAFRVFAFNPRRATPKTRQRAGTTCSNPSGKTRFSLTNRRSKRSWLCLAPGAKKRR